MVEHEIILSNHLSLLLSCAMSNAKRVSLELGGKSPLIIFGDCDMDKAVRQVSMLFCFNVCCVSQTVSVCGVDTDVLTVARLQLCEDS